MKIKTSHAFILALGIFGACFFSASTAKAADPCWSTSGAPGLYKQACSAVEFDVGPYKTLIDVAPHSSDVCCVPKGDPLCNTLGQASQKNKLASAVPSSTEAVPTYSCITSCAGTKASEASAQLCPNGLNCCAAGGSGSSQGSSAVLDNPLGKGATLFTILNRIATVFLGMVGALALGVFVIAGVLWITAGTSKRVETAQNMIKYAVIGLILIVFSYSITQVFLGTIMTDSGSGEVDSSQCIKSQGDKYSCVSLAGDTESEVMTYIETGGLTCTKNLCAGDFHTQCCTHP